MPPTLRISFKTLMKGKVHYLVKLVGWPSEYNQWVDEEHAFCLSTCNCGLQLRVPSLFWLLAGDQRLLQTVLIRIQEDARKLARRMGETEFSRECQLVQASKYHREIDLQSWR